MDNDYEKTMRQKLVLHKQFLHLNIKVFHKLHWHNVENSGFKIFKFCQGLPHETNILADELSI